MLVGSILAFPRSQEVVSKGGLVDGLVMTLSTLSFFVWFWSMGAFFSSIVQPELRIKVGVLSRCPCLPTLLIRFLHCNFSTFQSRITRTHSSVTRLRYGLHVLSLVFRVQEPRISRDQ